MPGAPIICVLGVGDEAVLEHVAEDLFDEKVERDLTAEFLADPRHHIVVALVDELVVGIATGVHYIHPDKPAELWVNEVGVAPPYQRQGIGKELMCALFALGRSLGCGEAWLGTEHGNAAARHLYASVGGREETMVYVRFDLAAGPHPEVNR